MFFVLFAKILVAGILTGLGAGCTVYGVLNLFLDGNSPATFGNIVGIGTGVLSTFAIIGGVNLRRGGGHGAVIQYDSSESASDTSTMTQMNRNLSYSVGDIESGAAGLPPGSFGPKN